MKQVKRPVVFALALLALGLVFVLMKPATPASFKLSDGTRLTLVEVTYGTNLHVQTSPLERLLGNRIPSAGINLLGWKLRRPRAVPMGLVGSREAPPITAWFELSSTTLTSQELLGRLNSQQIVARSRDGRTYENGYSGDGGGTITKLSANTVLWRVPVLAFPRTEKEFSLQVRLEDGRGSLGAAHEFRISNPSPVTPAPLTSLPLPQTNQLGELQVILDGVRATSGGTNGGASVSFRLRCPPALSHYWSIDECWIEDAEGNRRYMESQSSNSDPNLETRHGLLVDKPWRVVATLSKRQDTAARDRTPLDFGTTNHLSVTNASGQVFRCQFDGLTLKVESRGWAGANQWPSLGIRAVDPAGEEIVFGERQWAWTDRGCRSMEWTMPKPGIRLQLVTPKALRTEFVAMPEGK